MTDKEAFIQYMNSIQGRTDLNADSIRAVVEKLERYVANGRAEKYQAKLDEAKQVLRFLESN